MTKIYVTDLLVNNYLIKELESKLPKSVLKRCEKYKIEEDYLRSLTGWYLIDKYLCDDFKIQLSEYDILLNEFNKPYINSNIHFNISHSHNIVCAVISNNCCGIDIELVREVNNKELLCKRFGYSSLSDDEFIKEWTKKESIGKMTGDGVFSKSQEKIKGSNTNTIELFDNEGHKYYLSYSFSDMSFDLKIV